LVDDDLAIIESLELVLKDHFEIFTYNNPRQAIEEIDDSFDLVVTDLVMPEFNGFALANELLLKIKNLRIFLLTTNEKLDALSRTKKVSLPFDKVIIKPIEDIDSFIQTIKDA
jgi:two-component system NtrC family response regulator